ncbi:4-carboxymuconolactone decarboxylase [Malassezia sp. CBS 17886]|nr:4-carboxymuconolactone decarboxylase [Malassezia sp. CBS 17886]
MPYRLEYASTGRAGCHGPKPCAGTKIEKGMLRLGALTEIQGHHVCGRVACSADSTTDRVLSNIRTDTEDVQDLDGFEDLRPEDQEKVLAAFALGHLPPKDMTPCLREREEREQEETEEKAERGDRRAEEKLEHNGKRRRPESGGRAEKNPARKRSHKAKAENDLVERDEDEDGDKDEDALLPVEMPTTKRARKPTQRYAPETRSGRGSKGGSGGGLGRGQVNKRSRAAKPEAGGEEGREAEDGEEEGGAEDAEGEEGGAEDDAEEENGEEEEGEEEEAEEESEEEDGEDHSDSYEEAESGDEEEEEEDEYNDN